ncbi:hypothetical protein DPMN_181699 [Dreissena polymorpha]|uniref:Uncharacterized protein n=1 Tax=Dreissena polymorpha TaxID=45954 RepID=A0A9D4DEZ8_DREPO|nr:hypothetical protein DPMN_181699 [Dreissena polymorpha]
MLHLPGSVESGRRSDRFHHLSHSKPSSRRLPPQRKILPQCSKMSPCSAVHTGINSNRGEVFFYNEKGEAILL